MCSYTNLRIKPLIMRIYLNCIVIFAIFISSCISKNYTKYSLLRVVPVEDKQLYFLQNMSRFYDVNYWTLPGTLFQPVDFIVSPADRKTLLVEAQKLEMYMTTVVKDVEKLFELQTISNYIKGNLDTFNWNSYFNIEDIELWLEDLSEAFPQELELISLGKTYEDRNIVLAKVVLMGSKRRSKVFLEAGAHGREWITTSFVTYMIHQILYAPNSNNVKLKTVAETYEWYFLPVLNPDGYEYSQHVDRLWNKNRNNSTGHPTDLNRNFGYAFGEIGSSTDPESEYYRGARPFSERESRALANYIKKKPRIEYYFSFHSYGQYLIIPYCNVANHTDNYDQVLKMCNQASEAIASKFNTQYTSGNTMETVGYLISGDSGTWVKAKLRVPYVVTFDMRDNGYYGYIIPNQMITPTCQETMDGLVSLLMPRTANFTSIVRYVEDTSSRCISNIVTVFCMVLFITIFIS